MKLQSKIYFYRNFDYADESLGKTAPTLLKLSTKCEKSGPIFLVLHTYLKGKMPRWSHLAVIVEQTPILGDDSKVFLRQVDGWVEFLILI